MTRKPVSEGTVTTNVLVHGTGALCIGRCRVGTEVVTTHSRGSNQAFPKRPGDKTPEESGRSKRQDVFEKAPRVGRWPANVVVVHRAGCRVVGELRVPTGTAHRERSGGKTIFSDTEKKPLPNMTYGDGDGMETVPDWHCDLSCPVGALSVARFFKQVQS